MAISREIEAPIIIVKMGGDFEKLLSRTPRWPPRESAFTRLKRVHVTYRLGARKHHGGGVVEAMAVCRAQWVGDDKRSGA